MARGTARGGGLGPFRDYSEAYRRRVIRAIGITPEEARSRGISLQKARGHGHKTAAPGRGEKAQTEARQRARGELTEKHRRFLRSEEIRTSPIYQRMRRGNTVQFVETETVSERFARARAAFEALSPEERDRIIERQRELQRSYRQGVRSKNPFHMADYDPGDEEEWPDFDDDLAPLYFYH